SHSLFFFLHPATSDIYTLSLHDALPISVFGLKLRSAVVCGHRAVGADTDMILTAHVDGVLDVPDDVYRHGLSVLAQVGPEDDPRSEEHTSELQSRSDLVCRLLLEKKKK